MSNNWAGQSGTSPNNVKIQNFLEALRNSQSKPASSVSQEGFSGKNIFAEIQAKKEIEKKRIEQFHNQRSQEWNKVFSSKENQTQKRIEYIRAELKELAKQVKRLDINIKKAVEAPVVEYGQYQENYLDHIKEMIHLASLKVQSANSWLEIYQGRSHKQGSYWAMAKTKGTSYTQNNERNLATSIG